MRIDLHCHTKATKSGDGDGRNVNRELFIQKVSDSNVNILAITNHNHFDKEQYIDFKDAVKEFCQVWPGVEIDVLGETHWHMIVVANPDNLDSFSKKIDSLFDGKNLNTCTLSMEEIYETLDDCDVIYIPHYHKKPEIKESDREKLFSLVGDESRIFLELSNHRSLGVYTNYGYKSIIGSDVKDWNTYDNCEFAELKLPVESFHQFCLLSKRDKDVVETLLNKKESISLLAKPHEDVSFEIKVYQDINIIFGPKGTGKSKIVKSMHDDMISKGIKCTYYKASDKVEEFKALLSISNLIPSCEEMGVDSCKNELQIIKDWVEITPTNFNQYLTWYNTRGNNANKQRMKITEASAIPYIHSEKYDIHKSDKEAINNITKDIDRIDLVDYINEEDIKNLRLLIHKLQFSIIDKRTEDLIDEYSCVLANKTIETIKGYADKNTDSLSKPASTGYTEFALKRIKLLKALKKIQNTINSDIYIKSERLGILEDKGTIYINTCYRFLCKDSTAKEYKSSTYQKLKNVLTLINETTDNIFSDDIALKVNELKLKLSDLSIISVDAFIGVSKYIVDSSGNKYTPSDGEESIILLQRALTQQSDAYFLDEPELGMGNSYIDATIRPLIIDLAKSRKYLIIATHNANIAVRTLPYVSIFRNHGDEGYSTYIGNPFNDQLVNIEDENDVKSWSEESLHTLEGGADAFYERKDIYESKNN